MKRRWIAAAAWSVLPCLTAGPGGFALTHLVHAATTAPTGAPDQPRSTTTPAVSSTPSPGGHGRTTTRPGDSWRGPRGPQITAAEWDAVARFMRKNSPFRWQFIESLPEGPRRLAMASAAVQDYHAVDRAQHDPELTQTIQARLRLEDNLFELAAELRHATPEQQAALKVQLREKVGELTDATFIERQQRIDRLEKTLQSQQRNLAEDRGRRETLVDDRFREVMRNIHLTSTRPASQPTPTTRAN